jgi:hypothetical protein
VLDDKAEVINRVFQEGALFGFEEELVILALGKDSSEVGLIFSDGVSSDQEIIHIDVEPSFINFLTEDLVHHGLECGGGVAKAEEYDQWFKATAIGNECGFPLVTFSNSHIVISPMNVKLGEDLGILDLINEFRDQWERVVILDSHAIEFPIVLDRSKIS